MDRDSFVNMDMDASMTGEDGGAGSGAGRGAHEEKFRVYNEALYHAAACQEAQCQAHNGRCHKVKASIDHFVRCYGPRRKVSPIERYCSDVVCTHRNGYIPTLTYFEFYV
jgi:hypothetical protein